MTGETDYKAVLAKQEFEFQNALGEALYGVSPEGLPLWGDHIAETLAIEAAWRIKQLTEALQQIADPAIALRELATDGELDTRVAAKMSDDPTYLKGIARQALETYPTRSNDEQDARRYRAVRNHTQMLDPHTDGTALYRVRGISGRFHNFDEAADSLVAREQETPRQFPRARKVIARAILSIGASDPVK